MVVTVIRRSSAFNGSLCIHACVFILKSAGIFSYDLTYVVCNTKIMCPHVDRNTACQLCGVALPYLAQY